MIGKLEEIVLAATLRAGSDSNAAKIFTFMQHHGIKDTHFAAVYVTLNRMTKKGLLSERADNSDARKKRLFTITTDGRAELDKSISAIAAVGGFFWDGME